MTNIEYVELGEVCEVVRGGSPRPIIDYITEDEVDSRKNITKAISKALYYAKQD